MFNNLSLSYPIVLYVAAWVAMFYFFVIRKKVYGIGAIIIGVYMLSAFFSLYFMQGRANFTVIHVDVSKMTFPPFIYLFVCICICIWPFIKFSNKLSLIKVDVAANMKIIELLLKICLPFIVWGLITLLIQVATVNTVALADAYTDTTEGIDAFANVNWLGKKCIVLIALLSYLWPIFFFCCISNKCSKKITAIPLIASFCCILLSYACGARVGIFRSGLYFFIVYLIFKNSMEKTLVKRINLYLIIGAGTVILTLALITISRFSESDEDIISWIAMYAGEGPLRFSEYAWNLNVTSEGDSCFSLFKQMLGMDTFTSNIDRRDHYASVLKIPTTIFYTFVGDWYIDLGFFPTLILCLCISYVLYKILKKITTRGTIQLTSIATLSIACLVFVLGFTYYSIKTYTVQMDIVRSFVFLFGVKLFSNKYKARKMTYNKF